MSDVVGAYAVEDKPVVLDGRSEGCDCPGHDTGVHEDVEVRGHPRWGDSVFETMKEHHLPAYQGALRRSSIGQLGEGVPEPGVVPGEGRQLHLARA
jgi:hypothetical protein